MANDHRASGQRGAAARRRSAGGHRQAGLRHRTDGDHRQRRQGRAGVDRQREDPGPLVHGCDCGWRMIYTARQLEDLWKANGSNGQVVLPYRARLSPMASDWIKSKKINVGYSDDAAVKVESKPAIEAAIAPAAGSFLWWCDGPCGTAKAALSAQARESKLG